MRAVVSRGGEARRASRLQPEQEEKCSQPSSEDGFLLMLPTDLDCGDVDRLADGLDGRGAV